MRERHLRLVFSRSDQESLAPLVRDERLRQSRQGPPLPRQAHLSEACARIDSGRSPRHVLAPILRGELRRDMRYKTGTLVTASLLILAATADIVRADAPQSGTAVAFAVSRPVRELPPDVGNKPTQMHPRINPLAGESDRGERGTWNRGPAPLDPLALLSHNPASPTPPLDLEFDGIANPYACGGCSPPDTNGDVGSKNYVQIVNATKIGIFKKKTG